MEDWWDKRPKPYGKVLQVQIEQIEQQAAIVFALHILQSLIVCFSSTGRRGGHGCIVRASSNGQGKRSVDSRTWYHGRLCQSSVAECTCHLDPLSPEKQDKHHHRPV